MTTTITSFDRSNSKICIFNFIAQAYAKWCTCINFSFGYLCYFCKSSCCLFSYCCCKYKNLIPFAVLFESWNSHHSKGEQLWNSISAAVGCQEIVFQDVYCKVCEPTLPCLRPGASKNDTLALGIAIAAQTNFSYDPKLASLAFSRRQQDGVPHLLSCWFMVWDWTVGMSRSLKYCICWGTHL